jgi:hypothetical protein
MGKIVQKEISYSGSSIKNYTDLIDTLYSGDTTITFVHARITPDSTLNFYTDKYGVNPSNVFISAGLIRLTFTALNYDLKVKVRIWDVDGGGGEHYDDGNNIYYPVASPSQGNKLYKERDVDNIAVALDEGELTISEMAGKVVKYRNAGVLGYNLDLRIADYILEGEGI